MKIIVLLLVFVSSISIAEAQTHWGKAAPEDFSSRKCSFDSSANAVVLLDSASVVVERVITVTNSTNAARGLVYTTTLTTPHVVYNIYKRILILNKEGISSSTITIPVVSLLHYQQVSNLEAQTLNLNDKGKIDVRKIKSSAIYYDTLIKGAASTIKFTFPDVKEGSIIEYKYTSTILGLQINDWLFQSPLPAVRSAISLKIPDYAFCDMRFFGFLNIIKDKIEHYNDWANDITGMKAHFAMDKVPAYKAEPFVSSNYDNLNKIRFYPQTVLAVNGVSKHTGYSNWHEVARTMSNGGKYFAPIGNVAWEFLAKHLVEHITDKGDKVKAIYNYVHTSIKWNKQYSYTPLTYGVAKSGNDNNGNSADLNLILLSMLRSVDIKAYPVVVSTRDHGWVDTTYCNPRQFNNVIVMAELDSTSVMLDAINPHCPWYMLPENDLNSSGLKISETLTDTTEIIKAQWVNITSSPNSSTTLASILYFDSSGNYTAKDVLSASDYCALLYRDKPAEKTQAEYIKAMLKMPDDLDIKVDTVENENDVDRRLRVVFDVEKKSNTTSDSLLYITPFPIKFYSDNPFKQNERVNPIEFGYGIQRSLSCSFTLPPNYSIVELPGQMKLKLDDGSASFTFLVSVNDFNVQLLANFKVSNAEYSADRYADLKAIYAKMIDACNSLIVLRKM